MPILKCLCGANVIANDEKMTLTHQGKECDGFRDMILRHLSGNIYVDNPQQVTADQEKEEVEKMLGAAKIRFGDAWERTIYDTARSFSLTFTSAEDAALKVLREMRARGYVIDLSKVEGERVK
jgi:hypothetical protein